MHPTQLSLGTTLVPGIGYILSVGNDTTPTLPPSTFLPGAYPSQFEEHSNTMTHHVSFNKPLHKAHVILALTFFQRMVCDPVR